MNENIKGLVTEEQTPKLPSLHRNDLLGVVGNLLGLNLDQVHALSNQFNSNFSVYKNKSELDLAKSAISDVREVILNNWKNFKFQRESFTTSDPEKPFNISLLELFLGTEIQSIFDSSADEQKSNITPNNISDNETIDVANALELFKQFIHLDFDLHNSDIFLKKTAFNILFAYMMYWFMLELSDSYTGTAIGLSLGTALLAFLASSIRFRQLKANINLIMASKSI